MISDEKFTRGEWKFAGDCYEGDATAGYQVCCGDRFISFCSEWTDRGEPSKPLPEDKANAHLIAVAPEMYRLLESVSKKMRKLYPHKENDLKIEEIDILLAKARGESC